MLLKAMKGKLDDDTTGEKSGFANLKGFG